MSCNLKDLQSPRCTSGRGKSAILRKDDVGVLHENVYFGLFIFLTSQKWFTKTKVERFDGKRNS